MSHLTTIIEYELNNTYDNLEKFASEDFLGGVKDL